MEWFLLLENEVSSKWITVNDMVTLYPVNGNSEYISHMENDFSSKGNESLYTITCIHFFIYRLKI